MCARFQILEGAIAETYVNEGRTKAKVLVNPQLIDVEISPDADFHLGDSVTMEISVTGKLQKPAVRRRPDQR